MDSRHEDAVIKLPKNLKLLLIQKTQNLLLLKIKKKMFGVQFHPEVTHSENGKQILKTFYSQFVRLKKNGI